MKLKSIFKRTVALALAMCCMMWGITAYADDAIFNVIYSGKLSYTVRCYMDISDYDAILEKVWYHADGKNYMIRISGPDGVTFNSRDLILSYNKKADLVDLDGVITGKTPYNVTLVADKVTIQYGLFGIIKSVTVSYNGWDYISPK